MKKYLVALCLLVVGAGQMFGKEDEAWAKEKEVTAHVESSGYMPVGQTGIITAVSRGLTATMSFNEFFDFSLRTQSGSLLLLFSPQEQALFEHGKLTRYFCGEDGDLKCRAVVEPSNEIMSFCGVMNTEKGERGYSASYHILDEAFAKKKSIGKMPLPPYSLSSIDGIKIAVEYSDNTYVLRRK